ncbi:F0F1 ATP synthase subunit B [Candidatus Palibaumannia cicadellinicola]|uniref:ATP synthase subunit b n=1 Tax=Candidatus Palibaumannia cicadellinicola TaxID=186490 RepID=A0A088N120_9GAMM|nr:F0F1 ATP synthase subunit B [Candidatus Baumannia cicadellinicola]AIN47051.1 ATP synthase B chain [Candidatus Baumannia cicadellinicola]
MNLNATILGQAIAFTIFVLFCMKYVWPPLISAVEKRQNDITESLIFVENAKKDLEIAQVQATDYLRQVKVKAQEIIEEANQHKIALISQAKVEAEIQCQNILEQTQIQINTERKKMYEELRTQICMLALISAEKIIEHSIDKTIHSKIVDKIITEISIE